MSEHLEDLPPTSAEEALLDSTDMLILAVILIATVAYFTKGRLWGVAKSEQSETKVSSGDDRSVATKFAESGKDMIVFYGSQTGTAEEYASRFAKEASQRLGLSTMIADLEDYDFENLNEFDGSGKILAFIMATYGEGEPPDNAVPFYEFFSNTDDISFSDGTTLDESDEEKPLSKLNYVVFGLGNSTYEFYNAMGRRTDEFLQKLGAKRIGRYGEGDDGTGTMDEDYLSWKDDVLAAIKDELDLTEKEVEYEPTVEVKKVSDSEVDESEIYQGEPNEKYLKGGEAIDGPFDNTNPYLASVTRTEELFRDPQRHCIHVEFDTGDGKIRYSTGDHLAIWPANGNFQVEKFLDLFGLLEEKDTVVKLVSRESGAPLARTPASYDTMARYYLDINGPVSRQLLLLIAPFAPTEEAKAECLALGSDKEKFHEHVVTKLFNLSETLSKVSGGAKWTKVPFNFLFENIAHLQPRYYSISSSSMKDKNTIHVTAVVESSEVPTDSYTFKGVTTNLLLNIHNETKHLPSDPLATYNLEGPRHSYKEGEKFKLPVHIRRSTFKLPPNPKKPVVMVGPGTGVAPFRGFLRERCTQVEKGVEIGPIVLFFGCRDPESDFLYKDEWDEYKKILGDKFTFVTAFSRVSDKKVYVQNKMMEEENRKLIADLILNQHGTFYVCGDAAKMARDVSKSLAAIVAETKGCSEETAHEFVRSLKTQNLYQEDVW